MSADTNVSQPASADKSTGTQRRDALRPAPRRVSMTAQSTLRCRAIEWLRPEDERVCYDPVASKLMGPFWSALSGVGFMRRRLIRQFDKDVSGMSNWIVGRTRYIDDFLKEQIKDGIKQLVILGAGYDTRAYRFHELQGLVRVLEVDHVATLRFKYGRVRVALKSIPKNIAYVPIDFASQKLEARLVPQIYDKELKTMFIWEGVTMYIPAEAVDQTLAFIAGNSGKGSSVVFDYHPPSVIKGTSGLMEAKVLRQTTARLHEPLIFGIEDSDIGGFLAARGFEIVQNLKAESLKKAYFVGKAQQRKIFPLVSIVSARVL